MCISLGMVLNQSSAFENITPEGFWIAGGALLLISVVAVIWGSFRSLNTSEETEILDNSDVYKVPFVAAGVLLGLYVIFKYIKNDLVVLLLQLYIVVIASFALHATFKDPITQLFFHINRPYTFTWRIPLLKKTIKATTVDLAIIFDAFVLSLTYMTATHWIVNNIFGFALCVQGIAYLRLSSAKVGILLLVGLFFYDIYFVYFTDVMVTVAKSLEAPIKLLIPKAWGSGSNLKFSMLGLGDVIIPGLWIALLLRFDEHVVGDLRKKKGFRKKYFIVGIVSYAAGLAITLMVLWVWRVAQPALLFLVPMVLIPPILVAFLSGELNEFMNFVIEENPEGDDNGSTPRTRKRARRSDTPAPEELRQAILESRKNK